MGAPLFTVLDTLSVLTVSQHIAFLATLLAIHLVYRIVRGKRRATWLGRIAAEVGAFALSLAGAFVLYALLAVVDRPMSALRLADPDEVSVDFHVHTNASHDGRDDRTPERVRAWLHGGGFDVAYVTDHRHFTGAAAAEAGNPARAGDGTVMLSGIEVISARLHLNVLGATIADSAWFRHKDVGPDSIAAFRPADGTEPVILLTIPGRLSRVTETMGIDAVEISDAAPRGLEATQKRHAEILRYADSLDWTPVAATDNHGWGRTAVSWSAFRIPGWRAMHPDTLDLRIRRQVLDGGRHAGRVIERRRLNPRDSWLHLAGTAPEYAWMMMRVLSWPERASWLAWLAVWAAAAWGWGMRRARAG